jgi:plastocyanin
LRALAERIAVSLEKRFTLNARKRIPKLRAGAKQFRKANQYPNGNAFAKGYLRRTEEVGMHVRVAVAVLCGLAAACSDSSSNSTPSLPTPTPAPSNPVVGISIVKGAVNQTTGAYTPNPVTIAVGTTVTWTNNDTETHTSTDNNRTWDSGPLAPGGRFSRTFQKTGSFQYFCSIHPNMVGTITVQ